MLPADVMGSSEWDAVTELLRDRKLLQTGLGWSAASERPIRGVGGFLDHAVSGLEFSLENFEFQFPQAVSCCICGGLFRSELWVMRRHRLECGWL